MSKYEFNVGELVRKKDDKSLLENYRIVSIGHVLGKRMYGIEDKNTPIYYLVFTKHSPLLIDKTIIENQSKHNGEFNIGEHCIIPNYLAPFIKSSDLLLVGRITGKTDTTYTIRPRVMIDDQMLIRENLGMILSDFTEGQDVRLKSIFDGECVIDEVLYTGQSYPVPEDKLENKASRKYYLDHGETDKEDDDDDDISVMSDFKGGQSKNQRKKSNKKSRKKSSKKSSKKFSKKTRKGKKQRK